MHCMSDEYLVQELEEEKQWLEKQNFFIQNFILIRAIGNLKYLLNFKFFFYHTVYIGIVFYLSSEDRLCELSYALRISSGSPSGVMDFTLSSLPSFIAWV